MARCRLVADSRRAVAGPHPTLLRTAVPPIALLLCAAVLPGQSADVLSKHNAAFLNGLWQAGYVEYADKIGDLVAASNLSDAEKKVVEASHTKLKIAIAAQKGDADVRAKLVLGVIDEKTAELGKAAPGSETANELLSELIEQYRLLADAVSELLANERIQPSRSRSARRSSRSSRQPKPISRSARRPTRRCGAKTNPAARCRCSWPSMASASSATTRR